VPHRHPSRATTKVGITSGVGQGGARVAQLSAPLLSQRCPRRSLFQVSASVSVAGRSIGTSVRTGWNVAGGDPWQVRRAQWSNLRWSHPSRHTNRPRLGRHLRRPQPSPHLSRQQPSPLPSPPQPSPPSPTRRPERLRPNRLGQRPHPHPTSTATTATTATTRTSAARTRTRTSDRAGGSAAKTRLIRTPRTARHATPTTASPHVRNPTPHSRTATHQRAATHQRTVDSLGITAHRPTTVPTQT
jgi:hypothetical protein